MTQIPRRIGGRLQPAAVGRPPMPTPTPQNVSKGSFIAMPAPALYYPDRVLNLENGGVARWVQVKTPNPMILNAGSTQVAIVETGVEFDQYIRAAVGFMIPTGGGSVNVPSSTYIVDVKRQFMNANLSETDQGWVSFSSVFGSAAYPHWFPTPLPLPASHLMRIEFRSRVSIALELDLAFLVVAKKAR